MKRSRAALLPTPGDPILCKLWIHQYKKHVEHHVDNLYICVNSSMPEWVRNWTIQQFWKLESKHTLIYTNTMIGHGKALKVLYHTSKEDLLLLIEDDCFVFKGDAIDRGFRGLEKDEYDLAGSPRMSCSPEIAEVAAQRWSLDYSGLGDKGPNFWPNCLFVRRSVLEATDLNFSNHCYKAGEYVPHLDYTFNEDVAGDTLVHMSLQIRNLGVRIKEIPQYHGHPDDYANYQESKGLWDGICPWTHSGSSSDVQKHFYEKGIPAVNSEMEKMEIERRYAWWLLAHEMFVHEIPEGEVSKYVKDCKQYVQEIIMKLNLSNMRIKTLVEGYKTLL